MDSCLWMVILVLFAIYLLCTCAKGKDLFEPGPIQILSNQLAQNRAGGPTGFRGVARDPVVHYTNAGSVRPPIVDGKIAQATYPYNIENGGAPVPAPAPAPVPPRPVDPGILPVVIPPTPISGSVEIPRPYIGIFNSPDGNGKLVQHIPIRNQCARGLPSNVFTTPNVRVEPINDESAVLIPQKDNACDMGLSETGEGLAVPLNTVVNTGKSSFVVMVDLPAPTNPITPHEMTAPIARPFINIYNDATGGLSGGKQIAVIPIRNGCAKHLPTNIFTSAFIRASPVGKDGYKLIPQTDASCTKALPGGGMVVPVNAVVNAGNYSFYVRTDGVVPASPLTPYAVEKFVTDGPMLDGKILHASWPQEPYLSLPYVDPISRDGNLNKGMLGVINRNDVNLFPTYGYQDAPVAIPGMRFGTENYVNPVEIPGTGYENMIGYKKKRNL